jgi:predicted aspartyl protease
MGTFSVEVTILNPSDPALSTTVDCLVDTGAAYSQAPRSLLVSLGIAPFDRRPVIFADGRRGTCDVGRAEFVANGRQTPAIIPGASAYTMRRLQEWSGSNHHA